MTDRRHLLLILAASALGPLYALVGGAGLMAVPLAISALIGVTHLAYRRARASRNARLTRWLLAAEALTLAVSAPIFYAKTGGVIGAVGLPRRDEALMALDRALFSWMFPDGQISYWLDTNSWIGPHTAMGRALTEFLQVAYFSYYIWGYLLLLLLGARWAIHAWKLKPAPFLGSSLGGPGAKPGSPEAALMDLQRFLQAWIGAYLVNFVCYVAVPAIGPQFVFADRYQNALQGYWLAHMIRSFIHGAQSTVEDCFPSGHTALSWITAIFALRYAPRYGKWAMGAAIPVTLATLYLRYHYVVDLIAALPLIALALWWGAWRPVRRRA
ncbi:MAG: phosphatase PAP2 family protein [Bdellovibrionales bacterium]|nr:phosphatase PAP2 family protein [Bdellovibrionales bacterium]